MRPAELLRAPVGLAIRAVSRGRWIGADLGDARAAAALLRERGYDVALGLWHRPSDPPETIVGLYKQLLGAAQAIGGASYVSIKARAFHADPRLYGDLLAQSSELGIPVHFDSQGPETAEPTFALIRGGSAGHRQALVGCTLPGRWSRSLNDAEALAGSDMAIRVVKGEWKDPESPRLDRTEGFFAVVRRLAGRDAPVRVATHDVDLAARSIDLLRRSGTPCELEVLYGFPVRTLLPRLKDLGVPIRVYLPFGRGWIPYCFGYVKAHPPFLLWLARDSLGGCYADGFCRLD
jgi:proline dehydrogenase